MREGRARRGAWGLASLAAHAALLAALAWRPARPRPPPAPVMVLLPGAPALRSPRPLALDRAPAKPSPAHRAARSGGGHRSIPVPRALPDTLPAAELEPVALEQEEVLPLGGGPTFTGDGVGEGPFVPGGGFGGGRGAGAGGEGAGDAGEEGPPWLRSAVLRQLQEQIDRDPYPAAAELMGWSGTVRVGFTILTDGSVADLRVLVSSGHGVLDRAALAAVRKAAPFPRPPVDQPVIVPVVWYLPP